MNSNRKNNYSLVLYLLLLLLQLGFLLFIKYTNQDMSLAEFSFSPAGNIFNIIIFSGIISGLILGSIIKKNIVIPTSFKSYLLTSWLLLILCYISSKIKTPLNNIYVSFQPADKLLTGALFTFYFLILLIFFLNIWLSLLGKRNPNFIRGFFNGILMLFAFFLLTFLYINLSSTASGNLKLSKSSDNERNIAVVLGAAVWSGNQPSPTLSGRVDEALYLLSRGYVQKIFFTGSHAPGEMSEAEVAYEYAKSKGADTSLIEIESSSRSTSEQIRFIKDNLAGRYDINNIILISDSYHLPRVLEISKFYNVSVKVVPSKHPLDFGDELYNKIRESIALFIFWCFAL